MEFSLLTLKFEPGSLLSNCHCEWHDILIQALGTMNQEYLHQVMNHKEWLPGRDNLFAAFNLPLSKTKYILLGESPYPRKESANGYAFWDSSVTTLWSSTGLDKIVNRATSLRNWIKMLLVARGESTLPITQASIALLDKRLLVRTAEQMFRGMMDKGILLLNASLVYSEGKVPFHAKQWKPFMQSLFRQLALVSPAIQLILLGKIAENVALDKLPIGLKAEHPYNISFISNQQVIDFFKPLDLLHYDSY